MNGYYKYLESGRERIIETYPNTLEYYNNGIERIEYYNEEKQLISSFDIWDNIPLSGKYISKSEPGFFDGEFISLGDDKLNFNDFKDLSDTLLVDAQLFSRMNSPLKTIAYSIWGIDSNFTVTGFEEIVIVVNRDSEIIYQESFDKHLVEAFASENGNILCLNFSDPPYTNPASETGSLIIKEVGSGEILLNRMHREYEGEFSHRLGFQEVIRNGLLIDFSIKSAHKTEDVFLKLGFIDLTSRKLYSKSWSKAEVIEYQENNRVIFQSINLDKWNLETSF